MDSPSTSLSIEEAAMEMRKKDDEEEEEGGLIFGL